MRLINTRTLELEEYFGDQIPVYAILSHTWRDEEVSYQDWQSSDRRLAKKKGIKKIQSACLLAQKESIEYLWVDTNCINKDSSSELTEAINSMFKWYENSSVCYVYIDDFRCKNDGNMAGFESSRWFTRGWTLQELLAPEEVIFFDASWTKFGTKQSLLDEISMATSIHISYLRHRSLIPVANVAKKMSWLAMRSTTREEDIAYCMLGIFEINMPLLYGEGQKAFIRLQEEIIKHNNDHTIFCWSWPQSLRQNETPNWHGCLAPSPSTFRDSRDFISTSPVRSDLPSDFLLTNSGLRISLPVLVSPMQFTLAILNVSETSRSDYHVCLCLQNVGVNTYARSRYPNRLLSVPRSWAMEGVSIYLVHERNNNRKISSHLGQYAIAEFSNPQYYGIFPLYDQIGPEYMRSYPESSEICGGTIALKEGDERNLWHAAMDGREIPSTSSFRLKFEVRMEQPESGKWNVTIKLQARSAPEDTLEVVAQQKVLLTPNLDFTHMHSNGQTLVRPILVSLAELLYQYAES